MNNMNSMNSKRIIFNEIYSEANTILDILREASIDNTYSVKDFMIKTHKDGYYMDEHQVLTFNTVEDKILAGILLRGFNIVDENDIFTYNEITKNTFKKFPQKI